jgi:hypothetical protein
VHCAHSQPWKVDAGTPLAPRGFSFLPIYFEREPWCDCGLAFLKNSLCVGALCALWPHSRPPTSCFFLPPCNHRPPTNITTSAIPSVPHHTLAQSPEPAAPKKPQCIRCMCSMYILYLCTEYKPWMNCSPTDASNQIWKARNSD